ncbi:hypothetical protein FKM82_020708 [Ascaphus truei]
MVFQEESAINTFFVPLKNQSLKLCKWFSSIVYHFIFQFPFLIKRHCFWTPTCSSESMSGNSSSEKLICKQVSLAEENGRVLSVPNCFTAPLRSGASGKIVGVSSKLS